MIFPTSQKRSPLIEWLNCYLSPKQGDNNTPSSTRNKQSYWNWELVSMHFNVRLLHCFKLWFELFHFVQLIIKIIRILLLSLHIRRLLFYTWNWWKITVAVKYRFKYAPKSLLLAHQPFDSLHCSRGQSRSQSVTWRKGSRRNAVV